MGLLQDFWTLMWIIWWTTGILTYLQNRYKKLIFYVIDFKDSNWNIKNKVLRILNPNNRSVFIELIEYECYSLEGKHYSYLWDLKSETSSEIKAFSSVAIILDKNCTFNKIKYIRIETWEGKIFVKKL